MTLLLNRGGGCWSCEGWDAVDLGVAGTMRFAGGVGDAGRYGGCGKWLICGGLLVWKMVVLCGGSRCCRVVGDGNWWYGW